MCMIWIPETSIICCVWCFMHDLLWSHILRLMSNFETFVFLLGSHPASFSYSCFPLMQFRLHFSCTLLLPMKCFRRDLDACCGATDIPMVSAPPPSRWKASFLIVGNCAIFSVRTVIFSPFPLHLPPDDSIWLSLHILSLRKGITETPSHPENFLWSCLVLA